MTRILALLLTAIIAGSANAQFGAGGNDPYYLNENGLADIAAGVVPSRDVNAKILDTQTIDTGIQNCILIAAGQSNFSNTAPTNFTPVNPNALSNLNPYDGAIYKAADPLVGSSWVHNAPPAGGHPALRLADALVTAAKCARVIIVPIGIDSTAVAVWNTGVLAQRIPVAMKRINQRLMQTNPSLQCGSANLVCAVLWGQGESDNVGGTSQSAYTAALNNVIATSNATATSLGWSGGWARWLVAKQTFNNGVTSAAVQAAQAAVVNNTQVFAGANADALTGNVCGAAANAACRDAGDGVHWTDAGSYSYAVDSSNGWQQALHASGAPF